MNPKLKKQAFEWIGHFEIDYPDRLWKDDTHAERAYSLICEIIADSYNTKSKKVK